MTPTVDGSSSDDGAVEARGDGAVETPGDGAVEVPGDGAVEVPGNVSVVSKRAPRPVGPYPHARRFGNLLFLSGIGPRDRETDAVVPGIEAQTRKCIENVKAILEEAGSSLEKVIDVTAFLTDIARDFAAFNRVYGEYFDASGPTRTTVGVVALPTPISIELKVVAEAPGGKARTGSPSFP